jgi:hypothetical protein
VLLELVPNTDFYVAVITEPELSFRESLPCLRAVIDKVARVLGKKAQSVNKLFCWIILDKLLHYYPLLSID